MTHSPGESVLLRALARTREVFEEVDRIPGRVEGFNPGWALFDRVHLEVSLRAEIGSVASDEASRSPLSRLGALPRDLLLHLPLCLYSLLSLLLLRVQGRRGVTAIWTGDFHDPRTGGDFRLGETYSHLRRLGVPFVEFIRTHRGGAWQAWRNILKRRRPAVYYESLAFFFSGASRAASPSLQALSPHAREVFGRYARDLAAVAPETRLFKRVFRWLRIRNLVAWEFSSRQAALILAAKGSGIPVIGFMHGAGMRTYMAHEFLPAQAGKIGPDVFGVWSEWWRDYYERNAGLYGAVEVSGPMRPPRTAPPAAARGGSEGLRFLWISEPLLDPAEAVPWLRLLRSRGRVILKKRPSTHDFFYNGLMRFFPEFLDLETRDGDIFAAIREADIVVGSHSTAVIDASLLSVPFLLVQTRKWGDYFDLAGFEAPYRLYVRDPEELEQSLVHLRAHGAGDVPARARERFYGSPGLDGSHWTALQAATLSGGNAP